LTVGQDRPHPIVNFRFVAPILFFTIDEFHLDAPGESMPISANRPNRVIPIGRNGAK
jgi:hypothetical protein